MASCASSVDLSCLDDSAAKVLKIVAIASILMAGSIGVALPIVGKTRNIVRADGALIVAVKSFAAGVILSTGFVHMLPSGTDALSNSCISLPKFPFSAFFTMLAALVTLLFDFLATRYYETKHREAVGSETETNMDEYRRKEGHCAVTIPDHNNNNEHVHSHQSGAMTNNLRQVVVSQILELGIVSHSVIIGLSLGVSVSPCTIRPLIVALSFHQLFEGFALGGCIVQAEFKKLSTIVMACFFAITTPVGIAAGIGVASIYNENSPAALITAGILDSLSAGILIYMSLVDLIADQFMGSRLVGSFRQQLSFFCLVLLGGGLMSALAIWA